MNEALYICSFLQFLFVAFLFFISMHYLNISFFIRIFDVIITYEKRDSVFFTDVTDLQVFVRVPAHLAPLQALVS